MTYEKLLNSRPLLAAAVATASIVVYLNTLANGFVFDANHIVLSNPWIRDIRYIPKILFSSIWAFEEHQGPSDYYRPLLYLVYMFAYKLFGFKPWGWHLINVLLHALNSVVVFITASLLIKELNGLRKRPYSGPLGAEFFAFTAALIFAVHPVNTEVVNVCVPDLLLLLFMFLSFYLYMKAQGAGVGENREVRLKKTCYRLSVASFFMATLAKETALVLPAIMVLYDYTKDRRIDIKETVKRLLPYGAAAVVYILIRKYSLKGVVSPDLYLEDPLLTFSNAFPALVQYIRMLILPVKLSPFYVFEPVKSFMDPSVVVSVLVLLGLGVAVVPLRRMVPGFTLLVSIIILPILPSFYLFYVRKLAAVADRYLYISTAGYGIMAALVLQHVLSRRRTGKKQFLTASVPIVIILVLYGGATVMRNPVWKTDHALWESTIRTYPENYFAHYSLGAIYSAEGRPIKAISELEEARRLKPDSPIVHQKLGIIYYAIGRKKDAEKEFKEVIRLQPDATPPYYNLGRIYMDYGRWDDAARELKTALETARLDSDRLKALNALAYVYAAKGDIPGAKGFLKRALEIDPNHRETLKNLRALEAASGG